MFFFHRRLEKYKRSKLLNWKFKFDHFSEFQNVISDRQYDALRKKIDM